MLFHEEDKILLRVKQWLRGILQDYVQSFMSVLVVLEVVLVSQEHKEIFLRKLHVFYETSIVHIVLWRPLVEY